MYNKKLFSDICDLSCSFEELKDFLIDINKKEFDLESPFDKYYSVKRIISAIERYQSKEIDGKFLSYWMNAYNWIIMGGFKVNKYDECNSLKKFLILTIIDWIDSLSFFDDNDDWYNLEDYKNIFIVLDSVLQDIDQCNAVFTESDYSDVAMVVLITNDASKYFIKVHGELDYNDDKIDFEKVDSTYLENRIKHLNNLGYKELKYCNWDDEN